MFLDNEKVYRLETENSAYQHKICASVPEVRLSPQASRILERIPRDHIFLTDIAWPTPQPEQSAEFPPYISEFSE